MQYKPVFSSRPSQRAALGGLEAIPQSKVYMSLRIIPSTEYIPCRLSSSAYNDYSHDWFSSQAEDGQIILYLILCFSQYSKFLVRGKLKCALFSNAIAHFQNFWRLGKGVWSNNQLRYRDKNFLTIGRHSTPQALEINRRNERKQWYLHIWTHPLNA